MHFTGKIPSLSLSIFFPFTQFLQISGEDIYRF